MIADALSIAHLNVAYRVGGCDRQALKDLNFRIAPGEAYGLVGESGSGKSTVALAAVRYLDRNGRVSGGQILVDGRDLMALSRAELRHLRSHSVSMVYQDPSRALNPTLRIGRQMTEAFEAADATAGKAARDKAAQMLSRVRIGDPARVLDSYPHELSGGMQQRVIIAMALSTDPALLILDEPTTGLDATVAADIMELIDRLRREFSTAILFISHSLPAIARMCDRVGVLYAGELVEEGPAGAVFANPRHPYTVGLLRCIPQSGRRKNQGRLETIPGFPPAPGATPNGCIFADRCALVTDLCRTQVPPLAGPAGRSSRCHYPEQAAVMPRASGEIPSAKIARPHEQPALRATHLSKSYSSGVRTLHDITLDLWPGETLGLVGESGSGKTTLARLLLGLIAPDAGGGVALDGQPLPALMKKRSHAQLKALQIIFQNPGSALNRSHSVRRLIGRGLCLAGFSGAERERHLRTWAGAVRLTERQLDEKPRQLSGGMQQRVAIARAFAGEPKIVVCDEPTSALDVSVQAAILNLLADLQAERQVSFLFISHDLDVVHYLSDRIAVLYRGRLMEIGPAEAVFAGPHHPYTEMLLSARDGGQIRPQDAPDLPAGCAFQARCPRKIGSLCEEQEPPLNDAGDGHSIRCHIPATELNKNRAIQK